MITAQEIYTQAREIYKLNDLADRLSLHAGTLKRWESQRKVPNEYIYDLNFLLGNKYDIKKENFRSHNEFFTKKDVAKFCYDIFRNFLKKQKINADDYVFIEPSCGDMSFYELMPKNKIGIDLEYKNSEILQQNYLTFSPKKGAKFIVLGNPPFGLRGNLALRFLNHSAEFADFVAFILPPLFNSDGKGAPKKRVKNLNLVFSQNLPLESFIYPNGKSVEVATVFQIWANKEVAKSLNLDEISQKTCKNYIKVYSLSDGGTPSSTRNKKMLYSCDLYLPSTCFNSKNNPQMKLYKNFESLPHRRGYGIVLLKEKEALKKEFELIDWEKESFLGTNSSLNLRTSIIENAIIKRGFYDKGLL
ncbi:MAG: restriction endonuclease subunit M [Campylobacter sp.]